MIQIGGPYTYIGPTDPDLVLTMTITLRSNPNLFHDGEILPPDEFIRVRGVDPVDYNNALQFLAANNLTLLQTHAPAKQMLVTGKIKDIEKAFAVTFGQYQRDDGVVFRRYTGDLDMPEEIISVLGLSNVPVMMRRNFAIAPPNTVPLSVATLKSLYNFPTNNANGQVVGIFQAETSHVDSDIALYFNGIGQAIPTIINVMPRDGVSSPGEPNLDICTVGSVAPGATIAMYYAGADTHDPTLGDFSSSQSVVDTLTRMVHPWPTDPQCDVISISFSFFNDGAGLDISNASFHNALASIFQDAAALGISVVASTGDQGTGLAKALFNNPPDGHCYVVEPSDNPFALAVGGTVVGNVSGSSFEEYIWNQENDLATGGGVSEFFPTPSYQTAINPTHLNNGFHGRGLPDLSANASPQSGIRIFVNGQAGVTGGTSYSTPLIGGLLAVINAATGKRCGMIHSIIYANPSIFRDINASTLGPPDNASGGAPGYPARTGWDGSTGLGIPDGQKLLTAIQNAEANRLALTYSIDGNPFTTGIKGVQDNAFAFTHTPLQAGGHTLNFFWNGVAVTTTTNYTVAAATTPGNAIIVSTKPGVGHLVVNWYQPAGGNPPYTYQVLWSTDGTNFNHVATTSTPGSTFDITGLTNGTSVWAKIITAGPTGLLSSGTIAGPFVIPSPVTVSNIKPYVLFVANFMTAVQWDDVAADQYFIDYSVSSSGPWQTRPEGAVTTGFGANTLNGTTPVGYPLNAIYSLNGGHYNAGTGFSAGQNFWVRVRAKFTDGTITTSAAVGPSIIAATYPKVERGFCSVTGPGQVDLQWDDLYPAISPINDVSAISYTINFWTTDQANPLFTAGPISTGFGCQPGTTANHLVGQTQRFTGLPAGDYNIQIRTSGSPDNFNGVSAILAGNSATRSATVS